MKGYLLIGAMGALALSAADAHADYARGRKILSMGCHLEDNTCYVNVSGAAVGPAQCQSTSIRWNTSDSAHGKETLDLLTAAYIAGKSVAFYILDSQCYSRQPGFPSFSWIVLGD